MGGRKTSYWPNIADVAELKGGEEWLEEGSRLERHPSVSLEFPMY
jgi:hypothetical protein